MHVRSALSWPALRKAGWLLLALAFVGCGSEPLGTATGRVTYKSTPVAEAEITFHNFSQGVFITVKLGPDGTYRMQMAQGYGLPPGTYQVSISPPRPENPFAPLPARDYSNIPQKYRDPKSSGLAVEVSPGSNPDFNFDMQ